MSTVDFAYRNWEGLARIMRVRLCPNPEAARAMLERVLDTPVTMRVEG